MTPRPRRLKVLDDGSLELPLASRVGANGERKPQDPITLAEPSMVELARIHDLILDADKELRERTAELPEITPALQAKIAAGDMSAYTDEDLAVVTRHADIMRDRQQVAFSADSPHGKALIAIVELLTGRLIEPADLPGWAMHWTVVGEVLARFMDPFAGRGAELVAEAQAAAGAIQGSGS